MNTKNKNKKEKNIKQNGTQTNYSTKLVEEVKEAYNDYKNGDYFKGTADEVISKLKDEAHKNKKV